MPRGKSKPGPKKNSSSNRSSSQSKAGEKRIGNMSSKRQRQYEHIKESVKNRGGSTGSAKRIAAATTNKTRSRKGETKS